MEFGFQKVYFVVDGKVVRSPLDESEKPRLEKLVGFVGDAVRYYLDASELSDKSLIDYLRTRYHIRTGFNGREIPEVLALRRDLFEVINYYAADLRKRAKRRFFSPEEPFLFNVLLEIILNENFNFQEDSFYTLFNELGIDVKDEDA